MYYRYGDVEGDKNSDERFFIEILKKLGKLPFLKFSLEKKNTMRI